MDIDHTFHVLENITTVNTLTHSFAGISFILLYSSSITHTYTLTHYRKAQYDDGIHNIRTRFDHGYDNTYLPNRSLEFCRKLAN